MTVMLQAIDATGPRHHCQHPTIWAPETNNKALARLPCDRLLPTLATCAHLTKGQLRATCLATAWQLSATAGHHVAVVAPTGGGDGTILRESRT